MDYALAIFPLILSKLVIPPLSYLRGIEDAPHILAPILEAIYLQTPLKFRSEGFVNSLALIYDRNLYKLPFLEAGWLSHLFVHANYRHLLMNLVSLYIQGRQIYYNHGTNGLYYLYFLGGVVASIPSALVNYGNLHDSNRQLQPPLRNEPNWLSNMLGNVVSSINPYRQPIAAVGCSGAVYSLLGYNLSHLSLLVALHQINSRLSKRYPWKRRTYFPSVTITKDQVSLIVMDLAKEGYNIIEEYQSLSNPVVIDGAQLGHGNHLQGLIFGVCAGLIIDWIPMLILPALKYYSE
jgi:membrane associated rhomboid family serine protease